MKTSALSAAVSTASSASVNPPRKPKRDAKWVAMMERRRYFMGPTKNTTKRTTAKKLIPTRRASTANANSPDAAKSGNDNGASWVCSYFLGQGSYGSVYLAVKNHGDDQPPQMMAVKTAEISRASTLMEESRILSGLGSPFVVSCYGDETTADPGTGVQYYHLKLEFCSGRSLADFMRNRPDGLPESRVKILATDILKGLSHIHCRQIIHCDIKPDNILLVPQVKWLRPDWFVAKIADFGLALEKDSVEYHEENGKPRGTTRYMSPELAWEGALDYGVDIWAFGCTVLSMLTGRPAWGEKARLDQKDLMLFIGSSDQIPEIPDTVSEEARDFVEKCLVREPEKRWTADALLRHPFLKAQ